MKRGSFFYPKKNHTLMQEGKPSSSQTTTKQLLTMLCCEESEGTAVPQDPSSLCSSVRQFISRTMKKVFKMAAYVCFVSKT